MFKILNKNNINKTNDINHTKIFDDDLLYMYIEKLDNNILPTINRKWREQIKFNDIIDFNNEFNNININSFVLPYQNMIYEKLNDFIGIYKDYMDDMYIKSIVNYCQLISKFRDNGSTFMEISIMYRLNNLTYNYIVITMIKMRDSHFIFRDDTKYKICASFGNFYMC